MDTAWTRKDRPDSGLSQGMRPMPLGWFFVAVWGVVCVLLAVAIVAVTMLS